MNSTSYFGVSKPMAAWFVQWIVPDLWIKAMCGKPSVYKQIKVFFIGLQGFICI